MCLIDTGADTTLIQPEDAQDLGISFSRHFANASTIRSRSTAGRSTQFVERCDIFLRNDDGRLDRLTLPIRFARPRSADLDIPSLLGRDVINHYRLTFEQRAGLVTLELHA
jgi:hypothetical protein